MDKNFTLHGPKSSLTSYYPDLIYEILGLIEDKLINKAYTGIFVESSFIRLYQHRSGIFQCVCCMFPAHIACFSTFEVLNNKSLFLPNSYPILRNGP